MKARSAALFAVLISGVGAVVAVGGCGEQTRLLRVKAASDFKCEQAAISTASQQVPGLFLYEKASGCGRENWYIWDGSKFTSPFDRATFDLACPVEELRAAQLGRTSVGVRGCGKKAVYVLGNHEWLLNSSVDSDAAAAVSSQ